MADIVPRGFWSFPSQRMSSLIDEIDDLLPITQTNTASALSVSEDDKHIHIEVAMPGVEPDDVEVTLDRGTVWIRGQAREEEKNKKRKYYRQAARAFSYRIAVPGDIDSNAKPEAEYRNGIVMVTFPKAASSMPQKITVKRGKSDGEAKQQEKLSEKK